MNTLHEKTLKLLKKSDLSSQQISDGAKVPYDWLIGVKYDRIKNPSVNRIQQLYEFLAGNKLSI